MLIKTRPQPQLTIDAASLHEYGTKTWDLIPLHRYDAKSKRHGRERLDGKRPLHRNWTVAPYDTKKVVKRCIAENRNVGVRLRADQIVIDVDPRNGGTKGFKALCGKFRLDPSTWPRVVTGGGGHHYYLSKPADTPIVDTLDKDIFAGVEFKSKGRQIVGAGSIHPETLKYYEWDVPLFALLPIPDALLTAIRRPERAATMGGGECTQEQIAYTLEELDATKFRDHSDWFKLMCACHHASNGDARQEFVEWSMRDPEFASHAEVIGRRWDSLHRNKMDGITANTLQYYLRKHGAANRQVARDVGDDFDGDDISGESEFDFEGPTAPEPFQFDMTQLPQMLDYAEGAMLKANAPLYQTGGRVVHPLRLDRDSDDVEAVRRKAGALTIRDVSALRLREYMITHAPFHKIVRPPNGGKPKHIEHPAPTVLANHYLAREDKWRLPVLNGIIEAPTIRKDGTLLTADGYDEASGLLLDTNGVVFPEVKDRPSKQDALKALQSIRWPFEHFPFVTNSKGESASGSVMLSAVLTALVRRTIYSAPMHGFSAPTMGTGKTLAANVVSMIATGRMITAMSQGANEEEDEKRLFSVLLQNDPVVLIDNVKRPIEGDALCTILTEATWQSRILGESRKVSVPTNALFMASGNNLTFKGDMTTRTLLCRLDAGVERPETRRFDVDLKVEVPRRRPELVAAGLTILRAFVVAGRPGLDRLTPFGRFEDWSDLVRGALVWIGEPDPCRTRAFIAIDDPERNELERLLQAMHDNAKDWLSAGEWIALAEKTSDEALEEAIEEAVPKATSAAFGYYLKSKQGKILGGLRLRGRHDGKSWSYRVHRV